VIIPFLVSQLNYQELLLDCDSLPPSHGAAEQAIAKETLEYAVILSIKCGDKFSFQRYLSSLRPYYTAARYRIVSTRSVLFTALLYFFKTIILKTASSSSAVTSIFCINIYRDAPQSDIMFTILGLNLLYLLVENRLADFHCEVRETY
jgi:hypothetical protein